MILRQQSWVQELWDWSEPHNLGINFPVIRHFSSSLQNAYSSEELNGLLFYQNSIFFQLQWGFTHWPPDQAGALPPDPPCRLTLRALAMSSPHCLEEVAATGVECSWVCWPVCVCRRVYLAYLDSVNLFQPSHLRTLVYQQLLLAYFDYVRSLGWVKQSKLKPPVRLCSGKWLWNWFGVFLSFIAKIIVVFAKNIC